MTAVLTVSKITKAYSLGKENTLDDIPGYMNAGENDEAWYSNLEILHVIFLTLEQSAATITLSFHNKKKLRSGILFCALKQAVASDLNDKKLQLLCLKG